MEVLVRPGLLVLVAPKDRKVFQVSTEKRALLVCVVRRERQVSKVFLVLPVLPGKSERKVFRGCRAFRECRDRPAQLAKQEHGVSLVLKAKQVLLVPRVRPVLLVPRVKQVLLVPRVRPVLLVPRVKQVLLVPRVRPVLLVPRVRPVLLVPRVKQVLLVPRVKQVLLVQPTVSWRASLALG